MGRGEEGRVRKEGEEGGRDVITETTEIRKSRSPKQAINYGRPYYEYSNNVQKYRNKLIL